MTADARPPIASTPTAVTCRHQALREGYRLFPTRLSFERSALQSSVKPLRLGLSHLAPVAALASPFNSGAPDRRSGGETAARLRRTQRP